MTTGRSFCLPTLSVQKKFHHGTDRYELGLFSELSTQYILLLLQNHFLVLHWSKIEKYKSNN